MIKYLTLALGLSMYSPAYAWESIQEMNELIDQTNFIVGAGCSGTLISVPHKLIVTAHHCIKDQIKQVNKEVVDAKGTIRTIKLQKLDPVNVSQKDYTGFKNVGSLQYITKIVAYAPDHDLALLQLVGNNLRSTRAAPVFPEGERVLRGQPVVAVGNPRMLDASVTSGVVSSTTRSFTGPFPEEVNLLQFDANIQPGSSGGALFTTSGYYIGTTVAMFPGSDLGLAIPVYDLQDLLSENCFASIFDNEADDVACRLDKVLEEVKEAEEVE